jgi:hypothetical protein
MNKQLPLSCALHWLVVLLIVGCAVRRPAVVDVNDALVLEAKGYVVTVNSRMPLWDADDLGQFERQEIAQVKEDIRAAQLAPTREELLRDANQLQADFEALMRMDHRLRIDGVI